MKLLNQLREAEAIENAIIESGGELTEDIEKALEENKDKILTQVDKYAFVMERLKTSAKFWKDKAKEYATIGKSCELAEKRLKEYVKTQMEAAELPEVKGNEKRFKLVNCAERLVIDGDIPGKWLMEVVKYEPDKDRIKEALKAGEDIEGAHMEGGQALRTYANKG